MLVKDLKPGDKIFLIVWIPYVFETQFFILEVVSNTLSRLFEKHRKIMFNTIIGEQHSMHVLYDNLDLDKMNIERYEFDDVFVTGNENLFVTIYEQLIKNKTYDKELIRRVIYY